MLADMAGADNVSEMERQLISKFATLALQLEMMEVAALEGSGIDLDLFSPCAGHMRRIAETLGLQRRTRDVGEMSLATYIATTQPPPAPVDWAEEEAEPPSRKRRASRKRRDDADPKRNRRDRDRHPCNLGSTLGSSTGCSDS